MNDNDLINAVREPLAAVRSNTPLEQIERRSRAIRARRRIPGLAAVLVVVVAAALTVTALLPSGRSADHPPTAQVAAWTVVRHGGKVTVVIREFRNPAGLQRKLRADGVPASVIFYRGKMKPHTPFRKLFQVWGNPCRSFRGGQGKLLKVVPPQHPLPPLDPRTTIVVRPSALPRHAGIQFIATSNVGRPHTSGPTKLGVWLVNATGHCTGS